MSSKRRWDINTYPYNNQLVITIYVYFTILQGFLEYYRFVRKPPCIMLTFQELKKLNKKKETKNLKNQKKN